MTRAKSRSREARMQHKLDKLMMEYQMAQVFGTRTQVEKLRQRVMRAAKMLGFNPAGARAGRNHTGVVLPRARGVKLDNE